MPSVRLLSAALFALITAAAPAGAQQPFDPCTISATGVAFGSYDTKSPAADLGFGTISLDCHPSAKPVIALGPGFGGNLLQRRMRSGAHGLVYNLYTDPSFSRIWGDGTGGTVAVPVDKKETHTTVYGRIPPGQNVAAGTYSDLLVVTVIF